jgi:hypothetical protein
MALSLLDLARDINGKESRRIRDRIREHLLVTPGESAGLARRDPAWDGGDELRDLSRDELKEAAKEFLAQGVAQLAAAQELLWASDTFSLLVVFQGMDASGKDSTIKHVMQGVNPQGVTVTSFRGPSDTKSWTTTSSGASQRRSRSADASASSTAPTTRKWSPSACTPTGWSGSGCRRR